MATPDNDDDDALTDPVPDPETEPTPAERAHARRFAALVDKTLSGFTPPAISADDRALLEVATVIRATRGNLELAPSTQRAAIEAALRQAIGAEPSGGSVAAIARPRRRAPWIIASASTLVAAAAVAMLWLNVRQAAPGTAGSDRRAALGVTRHAATGTGRPDGVPEEWTSRPADELVGPIAREHAGDASSRIDAIFADRLDGFRARRLVRGGTP